MRTGSIAKYPDTVQRSWHRFHGLSVKEFAAQAGVKPAEIKAAIERGWFDQRGRQPELFNLTPGEVYPRWSLSPAALERFRRAVIARELDEARKRTRMRWEQGVYVVRTEEGPRRYKIGYTSDMARRMEGLRGGSPVRLSLVAFIPGKTQRMEYRLHRVFARTRMHGEWFEESPALLHLCEKYAYNGPQP